MSGEITPNSLRLEARALRRFISASGHPYLLQAIMRLLDVRVDRLDEHAKGKFCRVPLASINPGHQVERYLAACFRLKRLLSEEPIAEYRDMIDTVKERLSLLISHIEQFKKEQMADYHSDVSDLLDGLLTVSANPPEHAPKVLMGLSNAFNLSGQSVQGYRKAGVTFQRSLSGGISIVQSRQALFPEKPKAAGYLAAALAAQSDFLLYKNEGTNEQATVVDLSPFTNESLDAEDVTLIFSKGFSSLHRAIDLFNFEMLSSEACHALLRYAANCFAYTNASSQSRSFTRRLLYKKLSVLENSTEFMVDILNIEFNHLKRSVADALSECKSDQLEGKALFGDIYLLQLACFQLKQFEERGGKVFSEDFLEKVCSIGRGLALKGNVYFVLPEDFKKLLAAELPRSLRLPTLSCSDAAFKEKEMVSARRRGSLTRS